MIITVRDLIETLKDASPDGTITIRVPTQAYDNLTEIADIHIEKYGVEIETGMIDTEDDHDPCALCQEWECTGCEFAEKREDAAR